MQDARAAMPYHEYEGMNGLKVTFSKNITNETSLVQKQPTIPLEHMVNLYPLVIRGRDLRLQDTTGNSRGWTTSRLLPLHLNSSPFPRLGEDR